LPVRFRRQQPFPTSELNHPPSFACIRDNDNDDDDDNDDDNDDGIFSTCLT
jgi:hypothetical protein